MLRRLCFIQLLSAADSLWTPSCPFSLCVLLTHLHVRGSWGEPACPQGLILGDVPCGGTWLERGSSWVVFLCVWPRLLCLLGRRNEPAKLEKKKIRCSSQTLWLLKRSQSTSRTLLSCEGFDKLNLYVTLGKNHFLREVMSANINSHAQIILSLDFRDISSAEWKLQSLLCCQKQPPYKSNLQRIEMGVADGMTLVLGAGRVNFASKKLVTSLGSVATWCTQLFWRRRLRFRVRVGSCIFVTLPRVRQAQGSALQGG